MPNIFGSLSPIRSCVTWLHVSPSHLPICSDNLNPCWQHFILTTWHQGTSWRQGRDTGTRREHWSSICNEQRPEIPSVNWSRFSLAWETCDVIAPSLSAWQRDSVTGWFQVSWENVTHCHTRISLVTTIRTLNEMLIGEESKNFIIHRFLNQFSHDCDSSNKHSGKGRHIFYLMTGTHKFLFSSL